MTETLEGLVVLLPLRRSRVGGKLRATETCSPSPPMSCSELQWDMGEGSEEMEERAKVIYDKPGAWWANLASLTPAPRFLSPAWLAGAEGASILARR